MTVKPVEICASTDTDGQRVRAPKALGPGDVIDHKFEIIEQLGKGGMGTVFRVRHLLLEKEMAVKVLHAFGSYDDVSEQRFRDEAKILARAAHENIVEVVDAGVTPSGDLYLAMALLRGETLKEWMEKVSPEERGPEFIDTFVHYMTAVSEAVHALHALKVIHRDLKPENVILHRETTDNGTEIVVPKVIDLGIAKQLDAVHKRTVEGAILGTQAYIAPEVRRGAEPDEKSDVFALGVVLYQGLTGRKPEIANRNDIVFNRAMERQHVLIPPSRINPHVTRKLDALCKSALEPRPDMRLSSALELSSRLAELPSFTAPVSAASPSTRKPRPATLLYLVTALILLVAVGIFAMQWISTPTKTPFASQGAASNEAALKEEAAKPARAAVLESPAPSPPKDIPNKRTDERTSPTALPKMELTSPKKPAVPEISDNPPPLSSRPESETTAARFAALLEDGKKAFHAGAYTEAEGKLEQAVSLGNGNDKKGAEAQFYLSRIYYQQGNTALAIQTLRKAIVQRDDPEKRIYLGMFLATQGDKKAAVEQWRSVYCNQSVSEKLKDKTRRLLESNDAAVDVSCGY